MIDRFTAVKIQAIVKPLREKQKITRSELSQKLKVNSSELDLLLSSAKDYAIKKDDTSLLGKIEELLSNSKNKEENDSIDDLTQDILDSLREDNENTVITSDEEDSIKNFDILDHIDVSVEEVNNVAYVNKTDVNEHLENVNIQIGQSSSHILDTSTKSNEQQNESEISTTTLNEEEITVSNTNEESSNEIINSSINEELQEENETYFEVIEDDSEPISLDDNIAVMPLSKANEDILIEKSSDNISSKQIDKNISEEQSKIEEDVNAFNEEQLGFENDTSIFSEEESINSNDKKLQEKKESPFEDDDSEPISLDDRIAVMPIAEIESKTVREDLKDEFESTQKTNNSNTSSEEIEVKNRLEENPSEKENTPSESGIDLLKKKMERKSLDTPGIIKKSEKDMEEEKQEEKVKKIETSKELTLKLVEDILSNEEINIDSFQDLESELNCHFDFQKIDLEYAKILFEKLNKEIEQKKLDELEKKEKEDRKPKKKKFNKKRLVIIIVVVIIITMIGAVIAMRYNNLNDKQKDFNYGISKNTLSKMDIDKLQNTNEFSDNDISFNDNQEESQEVENKKIEEIRKKALEEEIKRNEEKQMAEMQRKKKLMDEMLSKQIEEKQKALRELENQQKRKEQNINKLKAQTKKITPIKKEKKLEIKTLEKKQQELYSLDDLTQIKNLFYVSNNRLNFKGNIYKKGDSFYGLKIIKIKNSFIKFENSQNIRKRINL